MLPPGPSAPAALQTYEWVARPTTLMRRAQARYGEPFTLRLAWSDAPMVFTSDPAEIKRVYGAPPTTLHAGASSAFLEPFAGPRSILVLDGEEHMRERKLMLPPSHGEALARWRATMAAVAEHELAGWEPGRPLKTLERMQAVALEVILRVVFGGGDPELRDAIRRALQVPMPMLLAMSLWQQRDRGPYAAYLRRVRTLDTLLYQRIDRDSDHGTLLGVLKETGASREQLRDQLATALAAGHETTASSLGWALERLARHPQILARVREGDEAYLDAVVKEVLRIRPVLAITPRKVAEPYELDGWTLPPGVHVTPCIYLAHRRPEIWGDPTAFRPERFLGGGPQTPYSYIPFGGGIRRCVGASFATMEMKEVLRALARRFDLRPATRGGERVRRRSITMTPSRGGYVVPHSPRHADVLPPQPADRQLPDLQSRAAG